KVRDRNGRWVLGPPKSEDSVRSVSLSGQLAAELRRWIEVERAKDKLRHGWKDSPPWLFYADVDPATYDPRKETAGTHDDCNVRRHMRTVLAMLPADFPRWFAPHSARHTFASQLLSEGKDLQYVRQQLGHESIKLTADTYGAWLPSTATNANDCLDDPNWRQEASHQTASNSD